MSLIAITLTLVVFELLYFRAASLLNIVDKPTERGSHSRVVLRGGGIVFPIAVWIFFLVDGFQFPLFLTGLTIVAAVSFRDDVKPLPNKVRILSHFIALTLLFAQWGILTPNDFYWLLPLLVICAGIVNAFNFMDGINGITCGYALTVVSALAYVNNYIVEFTSNHLICVVIISLSVFGFFNFRTRAKCFAGDVGSVSIAFIVLFLLGQLTIKSGDLSWIGLLLVYGVDSVMTILHRLSLRENIFRPHRKHLYQLLANEMKFPHVYVSLIYCLTQGLIILGYLACRNLGPAVAWTFLGVALVVLSCIYGLIKRRWRNLCFPGVAMP